MQLMFRCKCNRYNCAFKNKNIEEITKQADIVVAAVGRISEMVKASWIKQGATIIDVGINRIEVDGKGKLVGDVDFADVEPVAGAITPVPGGVGPMTIAVVKHNSIVASCHVKTTSLFPRY